MQETWVQSLGWEDPMEEEMATHSTIIAWEIPWTEEPGMLRSRGHKESDTAQQLNNKKIVYEKKKTVYVCTYSEMTFILL